MNPQPPPWPRLRQELSIIKGPGSSHGAPTFTLHDPVGHRFFRLGWLEMEIISRWSMADAEAIARDISENSTLSPTKEDVEAVVAFVRNQGLSQPQGPADSARLKDLAEKQKLSPLMFLVKNYLFLRLPLFKPDRFLTRTLPLVRPLFRPWIIWAAGLLSLLGLVLILRNLSFFRQDLEALFSVQGAIMVLLAMGLSKAVHELGHAYAAKLLGLKVPSIGIALMCFYPMLWTDTTEAWRCPRRRDRLLIGLSGVGAELVLASLASLAWVWLSPGLWREMALTLAGVTWISTAAINANPFMRYDAYYVLSDIFEMPMLQNRAFAMGKWFLRKKILGLGNEPPEPMGPRAAVLCIVYAYCTWVYRLFLFLGIAFLVYHMFFKALGLLLFLVEIIWFISLPVLKELREWYRARGEARPTVWGAGLALLLISLFIPWRASVVAPAILDAEKSFTFHSPVGARLLSEAPPQGGRIAAGELLMRLDAPDLDFNLENSGLIRKSLENQTANAGLAPELWPRYAAQREELYGVIREEASLLARRRRLTFVAPFDGEIREVAVDLSPGAWVGPKEPLLLLTGGRPLVEVLVAEEDLYRLSLGDKGLFITGSGAVGPLEITIISISPGALTELNKAELSSLKGGPLPTRQGPNGQLWPARAVYLVRCAVEGLDRAPAALTGLANLKGRRQSFFQRAYSYLSTVFVREASF